ncbi:MAG TPA: hypothetical protein VH208_06095 [Myxococcaceae bacterium]|nr:hypothetical protein [Myxococcaceae bacterium]
MGYRFFAMPGHRIAAAPAPLPTEEMLTPDLPHQPGEVEQALAGAEFRDVRARDWLRGLLTGDRPPAYGPPGEGFGRSAVFAQPPRDLPALLRLADQLETLAKQQAGERALVWVCACGTRYAVPVALARPVSIRCERCGNPVELVMSKSVGEEQLLDPLPAAVNARRMKLAAFFREAMARNWPVLVTTTDKR